MEENGNLTKDGVYMREYLSCITYWYITFPLLDMGFVKYRINGYNGDLHDDIMFV